MVKNIQLRYNLGLLKDRKIFRRAVKLALLVGIILNLINHPDLFFRFNFSNIKPVQLLLTFLVPYLVSTYTTLLMNKCFKPGEISNVDGTLSCNNCNRNHQHIAMGNEIEVCPDCGTKTQWKLSNLLSKVHTNNDTLVSLALFARHNPQPLFRTDERGFIINANPAADDLLRKNDLWEKNISEIFPELKEFDFKALIQKNEVRKKTIALNGRYYHLVLNGVSRIGYIHIYGNEITKIILAEEKIRKQSDEINESIQYASYIQRAMLPNRDYLKSLFPSNFIFYLPKNTVSGDFYWANKIGRYKVFIVADSTGHGVPGAFMSTLGISLLNDIILREKIIQADKILNLLRERVIQSLSSGNTVFGLSDGFDMTLIVIDEVKKCISQAGAFNSLLILRDGEIVKMEADRMPVGLHIFETGDFHVQEEKLLSGDRLYMATDGIVDQFGGEKDKKFSFSKYKSFIKETANLPLEKVKEQLLQSFIDWKGEGEQVDDVLVAGIDIEF